MLSFIKSLRTSFCEAQLAETKAALTNPGRGWYRIYTYRLEDEAWEEPVRYDGESLALVLFNIGAGKDADLTSQALSRIDEMLGRFERLGFDLLLRICYDTEGKGMVREPSLFSQVKKHVAQLAPILKKHAKSIFVYQGLLVGSWGEMHESKFLLPAYLRELAAAFAKETEGCVRIALRKPVQYRIAFAEGVDTKPFGFFNDGILGSESHLGTFGPETAGHGAWTEIWSPQEEITFMRPFIDEVPYGGEVLTPPVDYNPERVKGILRGLRVSYLNSMHDAALLAKWKEEPYQGSNFFAYVGDHLGYRFLVRKVSAKYSKRLELTLEVQNDGFGELYDDIELKVTAIHDGKQIRAAAQKPLGSLRGLHGGESVTLSGIFELSDDIKPDAAHPLTISIRMVRTKDQKEILFAQEYAESGLLLGEFR
ncbi:MAG: DUF4874 domain-containing protein [Lachnospiraceae bacterium]|nr:DUF4874 domain-containing protein [Lachnospiraceae bacterium]